jgi:hypothetical protein
MPNPKRALSNVFYFAEPGTLDLETILEEIVPKDVLFSALGQPGEHLGAARIASDEDSWKEQFAWLANSAEVIFLIPSDHRGTFYEIEQVRLSRHLGKTDLDNAPQPVIPNERIMGKDQALPSCPLPVSAGIYESGVSLHNVRHDRASVKSVPVIS